VSCAPRAEAAKSRRTGPPLDDLDADDGRPPTAMQADAQRLERLRLRLALLRERIEREYLHVTTLPEECSSAGDTEYAPRLLVNDEEYPDWNGEGVVLWHRRNGEDAWAVQVRCPHAHISLAESDIEDFGASFPSTLGPCIACPAHMYVFDLGTGRCLTDRHTPRARTYAVRRTGPHCAAGVSPRCFGLWLARKPYGGDAVGCSDADADGGVDVGPNDADADVSVGNQIQLALVAKGLRRRFGDPDREPEPQLGVDA